MPLSLPSVPQQMQQDGDEHVILTFTTEEKKGEHLDHVGRAATFVMNAKGKESFGGKNAFKFYYTTTAAVIDHSRGKAQ